MLWPAVTWQRFVIYWGHRIHLNTGVVSLLWKDTGEAHYKIDRMLFQMRMAGCFHGISGIVMGSFHDCGRYEGVCDIVKNLFEDLQVPILGGFDIGHGETNLTIPMGIRATLDTDQSNLMFHEPATIR